MNILIAIPAYSGAVQIPFMRSLIPDVVRLISQGHTVSIHDESGGAEIDTVRAQIVRHFLDETDCSVLVMLDSDLCWRPGDLAKLIGHIDRDDGGTQIVEMVAGVYPFRREPVSFPLHLSAGDQMLVNGLLEVEKVPLGFVAMTREACEAFGHNYPELETIDPKTGKPMGAFFDHVWDGKVRLSEDYSFCHRWRDRCNGAIWIDPTLTIGHIGQKLYQGQLGDVK